MTLLSSRAATRYGGAAARRERRMFVWPASDLALRVAARSPKAGADRAVQSARRAGPRPVDGRGSGTAALAGYAESSQAPVWGLGLHW
jgi:hypothetical protein